MLAVGRGFASMLGHTKDHNKNCLSVCHKGVMIGFDSAARLSKRQVWNCLCSHGMNRKSRVLYPGPGFRSSST